MKYALKIGDKVAVVRGKHSGKEDKVFAIDKKNNRIRLENFKKHAVKTKKGERGMHGTFHVASLKLIMPEKPKESENVLGNKPQENLGVAPENTQKAPHADKPVSD